MWQPVPGGVNRSMMRGLARQVETNSARDTFNNIPVKYLQVNP